MPRDYAKTPKPKHPHSLPGWVWMLGGLTIGLFVAFLVYLNNSPTAKKADITAAVSKIFNEGSKAAQKAREKTKAEVAAAIKEAKPKFDFYTILPELEVAIPEEELIQTKKNAGANKKKAGDVRFMLQAGSFRNPQQADRLKAELALQGIVANIQNVTINDGDTWYRVRIGPIYDIDSLNRTRKRLRQNNIASIVVREKG